MRTAAEIYGSYRIMPSLQLHQLRVAAAGKLICDHFVGEIDTSVVILACLFHDMGNIIKSDLSVFPEFVRPQGLEYWESIKRDYLETYGPDEHAATNAIAHEIGLPENVRRVIDDARFSRLESARDEAGFESKIEKYCDLRAGPFGILSLDARLAEGRSRYAEKKGYDTPEGQERYRSATDAVHDIEKQIFARCTFTPEDINDERVAPIIEALRNYPVA
jgi:hypothetical protein